MGEEQFRNLEKGAGKANRFFHQKKQTKQDKANPRCETWGRPVESRGFVVDVGKVLLIGQLKS